MLQTVKLGMFNKRIWVPSSRLINMWMVITNGLIATGVWATLLCLLLEVI